MPETAQGVIDRALAKSPKSRYSSAVELVAALRVALQALESSEQLLYEPSPEDEEKAAAPTVAPSAKVGAGEDTLSASTVAMTEPDLEKSTVAIPEAEADHATVAMEESDQDKATVAMEGPELDKATVAMESEGDSLIAKDHQSGKRKSLSPSCWEKEDASVGLDRDRRGGAGRGGYCCLPDAPRQRDRRNTGRGSCCRGTRPRSRIPMSLNPSQRWNL